MDWSDSIFTPPAPEDEYGFAGWSDDLDTVMLEDAYNHGVFPWPEDEKAILWFSPPVRGVVRISDYHVPHGTRKELKKKNWLLKTDTAFDRVIDECAAAFRPGQGGTWITPNMRRAYKAFHRQGKAHSFETYNEKDELIGGLYGVHVGGVFCGESMFFKESCASKFALAGMFEFLRQRGVELVDIQMVTPTLAQFGAIEITRYEYWQLLELLRVKNIQWS
ncbi:MAG: leucyl/phenylalanyl-tRNA--protein transferase [Lentisphaerae bacterium]|nr:leucyl/phenylalanyl-tRNA--protein transferase [Lentisphaerota bacterium]